MASPVDTTIEMLGDLIPARQLAQAFAEAAKEAGKTPETLGSREIERILKGSIYRQLQLFMPATFAKARIQQLLATLPPEPEEPQAQDPLQWQGQQLKVLEETTRKYNLYFEWPETQKLRALLTVLQQEQAASKAAPALLREGFALRDTLEARLQELLAAQTQELTQLRSEFSRLAQIGGPRVRRLESLLAQVEAAQSQRTLASAELERAHALATELRRLIESSVVRIPGPATAELDLSAELEVAPEGLEPEQSQRLLELDLAEQARRLNLIERDHAQVLAIRSDLAQEVAQARTAVTGRRLAEIDLEALREQIVAAGKEELSRQVKELEGRRAELTALASSSVDISEGLVQAEVIAGMLEGQALATAELAHLGDWMVAAERQLQRRHQEEARRLQALEHQGQILRDYHLPAEADDFWALHLQLAQRTEAGEVAEDLAAELVRHYQDWATRYRLGRQEQLQRMVAALDQLPELPELATERAEWRAELVRELAQDQEPVGADPSPTLHRSQAFLERFEQRLQRQRAQLVAEALQLGALAADEGDGGALSILQLAERVEVARERQRTSWLSELRDLVQAARELPASEQQQSLIADLDGARSAAETGIPVDLEGFWQRLQALRLAREQERAELDRRADALLAEIATLPSPEGEAAEQLRRSAAPLAEHRQLASLSAAGLLRYREMIAGAEQDLAELRSERQAAEAVLSALKDPGALEGLLGLFDQLASEPLRPAAELFVDAAELPAEQVAELKRRAGSPEIARLILRAPGRLLAGQLAAEEEGALGALASATRELSTDLGQSAPALQLEAERGTVLLRGGADRQLLVVLSDLTRLEEVLGWMGRFLEALPG